MAAKKPNTKKPADGEDRVGKLEAEVADIKGSLGTIVELLERQLDKKVDAPVTEEEKKVIAAAPDKFTTNPDWDQTAKDILGEYLDHTEVMHEKSGGIKFTVVIKKERSNAGEDYLNMVGTDRRTKEVGSQGLEGVIEWCRLIRSNLKRTEANWYAFD